MKIFDGYKTILGGVGLILVGVGGILAHQLGYYQGVQDIAMGLITIGARSFGQKILDAINMPISKQ